jgi:predicted O-linked N-acetylglucosamine transferase (SPINDLY family)
VGNGAILGATQALSRSAAAIQTAVALLDTNQNEQAKVVLRRVLQKDPNDAAANKLMGMLLAGVNENEQALFYFKRTAACTPGDVQLHFMLGNLYLTMRRDRDAVKSYQEAARLDPRYVLAYDGMAKCFLRLGEHEEAVAAFERGVSACPDDPFVYRAMASALSTMGRVPEAIDALRRGVARLPAEAGLRESLCYHLNFSDAADPQALFQEHAALGKLLHQAGLTRPPAALANSKDPERPLRVGILSADFCYHACATFMEGLVREFDQSLYKPYLYYLRAEIEEPTKRFAAIAGPGWRHVPGIPDAALINQILADQIDVLIDTMGWTMLHRMHIFEPRIAPLQMTWLGYPNTTGLPSVDYRIVDAITDPPGADAYSTERLLRLPGCFICFQPEANGPEPMMTPALAGASASHITFGSFNRLSKVRPSTARAWAAILRAVPDSRLILKSSLVSEDVKAQYLKEFAGEGVAPERLTWSSHVPGIHAHLAMYHQVDIALDSFPYNGTTTTCEATRMGVPVVTLTGEPGIHRARVGTSLLTALGLPELIAPTLERYVEIAVGLANDRPRLVEYHKTLRARMAASPLCDAKAFTRNFEAALRGAWREWCARPAP